MKPPYKQNSIEIFKIGLEGAKYTKELYEQDTQFILELTEIKKKDKLKAIKRNFMEIALKEYETTFLEKHIEKANRTLILERANQPLPPIRPAPLSQ
ncbi:MAG: hypothetical protein K2X94_05050 [Amoebophilaceae bacterium]|nr:hypothetical protein [Amoebophilaceae bacterium]